jgi:hypothetical protein
MRYSMCLMWRMKDVEMKHMPSYFEVMNIGNFHLASLGI